MIGVVLCGGESTRMGSDKGMLQKNAVTWATVALNKFKALNLPVIVSVNEQQYSLYSEIFKGNELVKDDLTLKVKGPLRGILSVHLHEPENDLFISACDLPNMDLKVFKQLIAATLDPDAEAFVYKNIDQLEPLMAIYTSKGLKRIFNLYIKGELKRFSLHYVLEVLQTIHLAVPSEWTSYFHNFNSPEDLQHV